MRTKRNQPATTWTQAEKQAALYLLFRRAPVAGQQVVMHEHKPGYYNVLSGNDLLATVFEFMGAFEGKTLAIGSEEFYKQNPATCAFEEEGPLLFNSKPLYNLTFANLPEEARQWFEALELRTQVIN